MSPRLPPAPHLCLLALALLGAAGCHRPPPAVSLSCGGPTWFRAADKPVPGVDNGSASVAGWGGENVFVVWSDVNRSSSAGRTIDRGASYSGELLTADGRRVDYRCDTADGRSGVVRLGDRDYDLREGTLFLVSTGGPQTRVLQLQRDIRTLKVAPEAFWKLAEDDREVRDFFAGAGGGK
jgi:hypothetical protein